MVKITKRYNLDEEDIKQLVCYKYELDPEKTTINVTHYSGDQKESAYTKILVEAEVAE